MCFVYEVDNSLVLTDWKEIEVLIEIHRFLFCYIIFNSLCILFLLHKCT